MFESLSNSQAALVKWTISDNRKKNIWQSVLQALLALKIMDKTNYIAEYLIEWYGAFEWIVISNNKYWFEF
jgi:hypothetical protein